MKYEIILFDVDDTLFDFSLSEKKALHKAFVAFGLPTGLAEYEANYKEISKGLWRDLEQGLTTLSALRVERFRRLFLTQELEINADTFSSVYLGYLGKETHLVQGAEKLCENLVSCRLAVITNGFTDVQASRIGGSPLCNTFEHIIISEEAGFHKPEKGISIMRFPSYRLQIKLKC